MKSYRSITYVTLGESPNGIFKSQVVDVIDLFRKNSKHPIKQISFISLRGFFKSRSTIKKWNSNAIVLPMVPRLSNWKLNCVLLTLTLFIINKQGFLIGRGVFATNLLLLVKGKKNTVVYDGRGALWAEAEEYQVYQGVLSNQAIFELEKKAVLASDKKIAVSNKLVEYWIQEFAYDQDAHTVIPCSYSPADKTPSQNLKSTVGWNSEDVVFIYSGSLEGWQGLGELGEIFKDLLSPNPKYKLLLLARESATSIELEKQYPNQVKRKWLAPEEVSSYLSMGDYGLLLRPESVTNKVASPVKFAEYVGAGLKVLISPNIGDFSGFTKENNLGYIIKLPSEISEVEISSNLDKDRISALADQEFSKENSVIVSKYLSLVN